MRDILFLSASSAISAVKIKTMATEFVLPVLGDGIDGGTLVKILVSEGDTIEANQNVLELETDKAVLEVPSTVSGKVQSIAVKEGAKIKIGEPVFTVDEWAAGELAHNASK